MKKMVQLIHELKITSCILLLPFLIVSCHYRGNDIKGYHDENINIFQIPCTAVELKGTDSQVKELNCTGIEFNYDFGWYSYEGPESLVESFQKSFKGYYHSVFFEKTGMDPKLNKVFLDSVQILSAMPVTRFQGSTDFECSACNSIAHIVFKNKDFYFPFTAGLEILENENLYHFTINKMEGYTRKIYLSKTGHQSGLLIAETGNPRNKSKLCLTCDGCDTTLAKHVFTRVRIQ